MAAAAILVTGAGGFVGAEVVRALKARGTAVTAAVHKNSRRLADLKTLTAVTTDLTDQVRVDRMVANVRPSIIINAASYGVGPGENDRATMFAVNVAGPQYLLDAARAHGVKRFVQLGSYWEYGDHPGHITEDTPLKPKTLYGATKAASSLLVAAEANAALETIVLRLFNIWGAGESPHRLIPSVVAHCRAARALDLTSGTQEKDYAYAPDAARWIAEIALRPGTYEHRIVNLASGRRISVRELATTVGHALQAEHLLRFGAKPTPPGEVQTGPVDTAKIDALLPKRAFTALAKAVAEVVAQ